MWKLDVIEVGCIKHIWTYRTAVEEGIILAIEQSAIKEIILAYDL